MSIIIHGPQGCGKTRHAAQLLQAFKLGRAVDAGELDALPSAGLYHAWSHQPHRGKLERLRLLILTREPPPVDLMDDPRVLPFERAMRLAGLTQEA